MRTGGGHRVISVLSQPDWSSQCQRTKIALDPLVRACSVAQSGFSLPGMVTPTLDVDDFVKRIKDMRAVEGWLKMN